MRDVVIAPQQEGKGRSFRATLVAAVEADSLWSGGETATDHMRPVWAMFAGSEQELRPFGANLMTGRKVMFADGKRAYGRKAREKLEVLRSAGFATIRQRTLDGALLTAYLPDLFQIDPGMVDPAGAKFICMPNIADMAAQTIEVEPIARHVERLGHPLDASKLRALVPLSFLFAAYLDRRTRFPLLADGRFYLQLLCACLKEGLASWPAETRSYRQEDFGHHSRFGFSAHAVDDVRLVEPIAFKATHDEIGAILDEQVTLFSALTGAV